MRCALAFLIVFLTGPAWAQSATDRYSTEMAGAVFSTALEFIAPRALEAVTVQQLALWGLRGITTLDPTLTVELADARVTLRRGNEVLFERAAPAADNADGWGALVADLAAAAWTSSAAVRSGGGQAVITTFFDELFNHLDPYSRYVPPEAADQDRARRSGEAGAGIVLAKVRGAFVVQSVNGDSPAAEAGIVPGDQIIAVDSQPTRGESLETVQGWIAGFEGTEVELTIRTRRGRVRTVEIERLVLPPETVFASRAGDLLVLRISAFSSDTDERFTRELRKHFGRGAGAIKGVVIDLRGNRGGLLRQAVTATDAVLNSGLIAVTAGRNPQAQHEWRAHPGDLTSGKPIVVLVDGRSASAAEIMAAALEGQGRGVVVGSSTLGKGLVQTVTTLPDGGELFVSWSRVLAPEGWPIQGLGVLPQVCTSLGGQKLTEQLDALERGTLMLAPALTRHRAARAPIPSAEMVELRAACPAGEAREEDVTAARFLIAHPTAYATALLAASGPGPGGTRP